MYELYKNPANLSRNQEKILKAVLAINARIAQAYEFKETFADIMNYNFTIEQAEKLFEQWAVRVEASDLAPMKTFAKTVRKHWSGILEYFKSGITNGIAEGINSVVKTVQGIARGFANKGNLMSVIYMRGAFFDKHRRQRKQLARVK